jgi:hypothetical protein
VSPTIAARCIFIRLCRDDDSVALSETGGQI